MMNTIKIFVEQQLTNAGLPAESVPVARHIVLVIVAILLSAFAGWLCKKILVPLVLKLVKKTDTQWDDVMFNKKVLHSAANIVPAIVIWQLLPSVFFEYPAAREVLARLTAIYITVMAVRTAIVFIDSIRLLEGEKRTARQQYLYSFIGVLKILMLFIAAIVVVAIAINRNPSVLFAGLGAASAVLMLAFQDTIKGLVAGVRLTSNDMLHKGDWITVPSAGANGTVEEITLTMVRVRNFDNTIVTVTPQMLVDGAFQNWIGMAERPGRKVVRKIYFDVRFVTKDETGVVNLTSYRTHMEQWLAKNPLVLSELTVLAHQLDATPTGLPVELVFWLKEKGGVPFEHAISEIMEYAYATAPDFGLRIYQQLSEQ